MKKQTCAAALVSALLISVLVGSFFVNLAAANAVWLYDPLSPPPAPIVEVIKLDTDKLTVTFSVRKAGSWITPFGSYPERIGYSISSEVLVDGKLWSAHGESTRPTTVSLEGLSNGWHTVQVIATAEDEGCSSGSSSGVIKFQVGSPPPSVQIQSLKNTTFNEGDFQFALRVDGRTLSWVGYSLDGKENMTVNQEVLVLSSLASYDKVWKGNLTVTGLSSGSHSLVVYAKDEAGNTGASATTEFTVAKETQAATFPTTWIATAIIASATIVTFGFLAYFLKRKKRSAA